MNVVEKEPSPRLGWTDFKRTRISHYRRKLQIFEPQLPRIAVERFKKKYPDSIIFTPFFSDIRHEILTGKIDRTCPDDPANDSVNPEHSLEALFPQVLQAASSRNTRDEPLGGSWLHVALRLGDLPLAHECVRLGTSISFKDRRGHSPLYSGCLVIKDLLQPDTPTTVARVNLPPGRMPSEEFAQSILSQMLEICLFLLEHHADPNEAHDGVSLLALACLGDQWNLIRALLLHGAESSTPSTLPTQFPVRFLKTERARAKFGSLASQVANQPRPPRICPCGSGRPLEDCHAQAKPQPYPSDSICPCGAAKIHHQCCTERTDMYWVEKWNRRAECLERVCVPKILGPLVQTSADLDAFMSQDKLSAGLDRGRKILKKLVKAGRIDPAYAAAGCRVPFHPIYPNMVHTISKIELNNSVRLWNEAVDDYISSNIDRRNPSDIEIAAKIGPAGGPLHCRCEAAGCTKLEGRSGVKLLRCGGCNRAMYCSTSCQKSAWKEHKSACRSGKVKTQMLPSQLEYWTEVMIELLPGLVASDDEMSDDEV